MGGGPHVKRLREQMGPPGAHVDTVRGIGYRLHPCARWSLMSVVVRQTASNAILLSPATKG